MKFVSLINFTDQGISDVGQTTTRAAMFIEQAKERGAEVTELLWLSGRFDGIMIFDAPDAETAAAVMLMLSKSGNVKTESLIAFDSVGINQVLAKM